jgi:opacity protein-like surface antigen
MGSLWRGEFVLGYQPDFKFEGNANFLASGLNQPVSGSVNQLRGGVNGYLDLMALAGHTHSRISPYLGAGVGVVRNRVGTMTYEFPELAAQPALTTVPGGSSTNVSWRLSLGLDVRLGDRNVLDIALSWNDYGDVRTGVGDIDIIRNGELLARVPVGQTRAELETWGFQVGLRHYFGR